MTSHEKIVASKCFVKDCCKPAISKGLCDMHRKRLARHGDVLQSRPDDWGARHSHPLYDSWRHLSRIKGGAVPEWKDFWRFVVDVGDRPEGCSLARLEDDKPVGPGNWYWQQPRNLAADRASHAEYMRNYMELRRKQDPWFEFSNSLRRYYGITVDEYLAMHDAQGGVCAICKQPEKSVDKKTGNVRRLAVDHCHAEGHNRALLCSMCNSGLGSFKDDIYVMRAAIKYLQSHRKKQNPA